jgi:hypothetical protein
VGQGATPSFPFSPLFPFSDAAFFPETALSDSSLSFPSTFYDPSFAPQCIYRNLALSFLRFDWEAAIGKELVKSTRESRKARVGHSNSFCVSFTGSRSGRRWYVREGKRE